MAESIGEKRAVLCEVNAFIARNMDKKKETCSSDGCTKFNSRAIAEAEEGRELMKKALSERFPEAKRRKKRAEGGTTTSRARRSLEPDRGTKGR